MIFSQRVTELGETDYVRFRDLVSQKCGLDFPQMRRADLERAIGQLLAETAIPDFDNLYHQVAQAEPTNSVLESLITKLTVSETHFFRNRPQFQALEQHILPDLIERRKESRTLRVWSAACASGEEPYSLAILLDRLLPDWAQWNILILATDINPKVLEKARCGIYSAWSFREVPPDIQQKYFTQHGREFEIAPHIRKKVSFAYLNLAQDVYPSLLTNTNAMDLIVCRNVLIYFRAETTQRVIGRLYEALAEDGWLVVGHAEPSQQLFHQFAVRNFPGTTVYQKSATAHQCPQTFWVPEQLPLAERRQKPRDSKIPLATDQGAPKANPTLPVKQIVMLDEKPNWRQAEELWKSGRLDEALALLKTLAAASPDDACPDYLIAKIYANLLRIDTATEWIDRAIKKAPLFAAAHYLRALILQEQNQIVPALDALRRCVYADPQFVLGHFAQATLFAREQKPQRARKAFDNVTRLLAGRKRDEAIAEGDGITVGRLLELINIQRELW